MKCIKSQTAIEFLILVGVMLLFFTSFFLVLGGNIEDKASDNLNKNVNEVALLVQEEIGLASDSVDGYYREFKVPQDINGLDYDINIVGGLVYIESVNEKYSIALPVQNVSGEIEKGVNVIQKKGGIVLLNS